MTTPKPLPPEIEQHAKEMHDRLIYVFRNKTNITALIDAVGKELQEIEEMIFEFYRQERLDEAVGSWLDIIGEIVNIKRNGRSDDEYRKAIKLKILINICKGTPEEVIEIYRQVTGSTSVNLFEYFPAVVHIYGNGNIEDYLDGDGEDAFAFDGGFDGLGFSDVFDPESGGGFAEIVDYDIDWLYNLIDSCLIAGVKLEHLAMYSETPFAFEGGDGEGFGDFYDSTAGGEFAWIVPPELYS